MSRGRRVYGVDFSGARDPSGKIYIASGTLSDDGAAFALDGCTSCDDRLDLFAAMLSAPAGSLWGVDVPFAPPAPAYERMGLNEWEDWLALAAGSSRSSFLAALDAAILSFESPCSIASANCRHTDVACRAASPFKQVQPNLRAMTYAGWKLLAYAKRAGLFAYPFDGAVTAGTSALFEVYPSHTARLVGARRRLDLEPVAAFARDVASWRETTIPGALYALPNQDAADAVVACLTLAAVWSREGEAMQAGARPAFAGDSEWAARAKEGLIVRLTPA
ncbi:hypothetical protein MO973_09285 [Paenibacillus sp. TRM 82003]|nr:hypothetical protein [Paenibacillus sp. TRM 82003]